MYGLSNGMIASDLEWGWRSLLYVYTGHVSHSSCEPDHYAGDPFMQRLQTLLISVTSVTISLTLIHYLLFLPISTIESAVS